MKNKKTITFVFAVLLIFSLVVGCSSGTTQSKEVAKEKPIELKLVTLVGPTHAIVKNVLEPWGKQVEEATQGRVKVTIYPVDTLAKATDIYEAVVSGIADVGNCDPGYNVGRFPLISGFSLAGMEYANSVVSSHVAWDLVKEMNLAETKDTKFMFVYGHQPSSLLSKKPINTLADLNAKSIRGTGFAVDALKALGASPVGIPMSEVYEAMVKGTIDGGLAPSETLKSYKFAEIANYILKAPFINTNFHYVTMNLQVWNSLAPDIQQAIEGVNKKMFEQSSTLFDNICNEGDKYAVEQYKANIVFLSDQEKQKWLAALATVQDKWIKDMDNKGLPGKATLDEIKKRAAKYNELYGKK